MTVDLPDAAWLAALSTLPGVGPVRLRRLLDRWSPADGWCAVLAGHSALDHVAQTPGLSRKWSACAMATDVSALWRRYGDRGVGVLDRQSAGFPASLLDDPEPPEVLFVAGNPTCVSPRTAAIVGTRDCTRYGIDLAFELGALLASNGVSVVSGLALGIDAAAHAGALGVSGAAPVGVVAVGLDRPYPRQNQSLWKRVGDEGLLVTEAPFDTVPDKWRFPARNRIIAGLSEVVVVVESHETGGSLYTAAQAIERSRPVLAVPGSIRSSASLGCNRLLADGCHPVCDLDDVLAAIGLVAPSVAPESEVSIDQRQALVLDALGWQAGVMSELVAASGLGLDEVALAIEQLREVGLVVSRGPWLERTTLATAVRSQ